MATSDELVLTPESTTTEPVEGARVPLSFWRCVAYCLGNLGYCMFYAFNNGVLPLWLAQYTKADWLINLLSGSHSFEGVVIQPLVGSLSDGLNSKMGRRRPIILLFTPVSCLFLLLTPVTAHLPMSARLIAIVTCVFLFTMTFNIAYDPYQALLADATTKDQRGKVTGFWYVVNAVGQASILLFPLPLVAKFALVAVVMLVTSSLAVAFTPDRSDKVGASSETSTAFAAIRQTISGLRTLKQAKLYLVMYLVYGAGLEAVVPNITRFVKTIAHCADQQAENALMITLATMGASVLPCGALADKIGIKKMLAAGLGLVGLASLLGLWVNTLPQVWVVMVIAGVGTACQNASSYPLLMRLVPRHEIGFYIGLQTAAQSIAGPLALILTGLLTAHGNYRMIFVVCSITTLTSIVFLARIRASAARDEVERRTLELARMPA